MIFMFIKYALKNVSNTATGNCQHVCVMFQRQFFQLKAKRKNNKSAKDNIQTMLPFRRVAFSYFMYSLHKSYILKESLLFSPDKLLNLKLATYYNRPNKIFSTNKLMSLIIFQALLFLYTNILVFLCLKAVRPSIICRCLLFSPIN